MDDFTKAMILVLVTSVRILTWTIVLSAGIIVALFKANI